MNLYSVGNDFVNNWDYNGLWVHPNGIVSANVAARIVRETEQNYFNYFYSIDSDVDPTEASLSSIGIGVFNTDYIDGSTNKWLFSCRFGWIDLGHFFTTAMYRVKIANNRNLVNRFYKKGSSSLAYEGSHLVEAGQSFRLGLESAAVKYGNYIPSKKLRQKIHAWGDGNPTGQSAGTVEDLNSNYLGANFSHDGVGSIATNFETFLKKAGAVNIPAGPSVARAVLEKDVRSHLKRNKDGDLSIYTGKRIFESKEAQLKYQRETFEAFCILCNGDDPKEEYAY